MTEEPPEGLNRECTIRLATAQGRKRIFKVLYDGQIIGTAQLQVGDQAELNILMVKEKHDLRFKPIEDVPL